LSDPLDKAAVVYLGDAIWRGADFRGIPHARLAATIGGVGVAAVIGYTFVHVRTRGDYGVPRGDERWTLGGELRGVRMDAATAQYLAGVKTCVHEHPARWVAVVPEGALAYAVDRPS
jgi:hypothetical protein